MTDGRKLLRGSSNTGISLQMQDLPMLMQYAQVISASDCVIVRVLVRQKQAGGATILTATCNFTMNEDAERILDETLKHYRNGETDAMQFRKSS